MVRNYKPVEIHALQWAKLFKIIAAYHEKGIAIYDLIEELDIDVNDESLEKGLKHLTDQGKIKWTIGRSKKGLVCRVVQETNLKHGEKDIPLDDSGNPRTVARINPRKE